MRNGDSRLRWLAIVVAAVVVSLAIDIGEHGKVTAGDLVFTIGLGLSVASGVVLGTPWLTKRAHRRRAITMWAIVAVVLIIVASFAGARLV